MNKYVRLFVCIAATLVAFNIPTSWIPIPNMSVIEHRVFALFVMAVNFRDGRVDIDHHRFTSGGPCAAPPRALQRAVRDGVELADMAERERPQERPDRGGSHDPKR